MAAIDLNNLTNLSDDEVRQAANLLVAELRRRETDKVFSLEDLCDFAKRHGFMTPSVHQNAFHILCKAACELWVLQNPERRRGTDRLTMDGFLRERGLKPREEPKLALAYADIRGTLVNDVLRRGNRSDKAESLVWTFLAEHGILYDT